MGRFSKKKLKEKSNKVKAYGFVGAWRDGTLGWLMPEHIYGWGEKVSRKFPDRPAKTFLNEPQRLVLCEITVKVVKNKKGKPIVRYGGNKPRD